MGLLSSRLDEEDRSFFVIVFYTYLYSFCTQAFEQYGEVEEACVITDKGTGKSRGFGFITFKHMDSAQRALKEPSKNIDVSLSMQCL